MKRMATLASLSIRAKRDRPNRKWTTPDIVTILNYLEESTDFEAPTAQVFYKKLLATSKLNVTWDCLRCKVRHLKSTYIKATKWRKSTAAIEMELCDADGGNAAVKEKILKICPHYYRLDNIFKAQPKVASAIRSEEDNAGDDSIHSTPNGSVTALTPEGTTDDMFAMFKSEELSLPATEHSSNEGSEFNSTVYNKFAEATPSKTSEIGPNKSKFPQETIHLGPKSAVAHLAALQAERIALQKTKFEFEKQKCKRELEMAERRLSLEEEKLRIESKLRNRELEFQILKIEQDERIQRVEIAKKERIEMYELELKYKHKIE